MVQYPCLPLVIIHLPIFLPLCYKLSGFVPPAPSIMLPTFGSFIPFKTDLLSVLGDSQTLIVGLEHTLVNKAVEPWPDGAYTQVKETGK